MARLVRRQGWGICLDVLFAAWAVSFMVSGQVLPSTLTHVIQHDTPVAESVEPSHLPDLPGHVGDIAADAVDPA